MKRVAILFGLLAGACALGPDYRRPATDTPERFRGEHPEGVSVGDSGWWRVYADEALQRLIAEALSANFDLRAAVARIDEARAIANATRLSFAPQLSLSGAAERSKTSTYALTPGATRVHDTYQAQVAATWQLDLWGQLRRADEAARAAFYSADYAKRAVAVTLVAEVADTYYVLLSLDSQLEIARRTVLSRERFLELTHAQHERGYATGLDAATAEAQLAAARLTVPDLERQIGATENQLSVLLGRNPGPVERPHYGEKLPDAPPLPPPGLPSELLERRPDVRAAEETLIAANANVGVAKASLFPNISLTGLAGSLSTPLSGLMTAPAAEWSAAAGIVEPLLSAQSGIFQLEVADARKREQIYAYRKAVQVAFQETADALLSYQKYGEIEREQTRQVGALQRAEDIALGRYRLGYASYFDVINADRDLFAAELQLAQAYANNLRALVRLYEVLGGGWQAAPTTAEAPAKP
jgi:outer membrane protein, multidrug efflux system